jgi:hypothetical protein
MKESILWPILQQARNHSINGTNFDVDKFHNKFAELIVRECTNFLKDTLDDHFAAEQLEEHFGVDNK